MALFSYMTKKGRVQVRRYYELPENVLTDPEQLRRWADESKRIATNGKKPKKLLQQTPRDSAAMHDC